MILAQNLRDSILQAALQGELTKSIKKENIEHTLNALCEELSIQKISTYNVDDEYNLPENWVGLRIKDIVLKDVTYGIVKLGEEDKNGVKVLRCSDVKYKYIDTSKIRTVSQCVSDKYKRTILSGGEIVINVRGTLGGCAIVPESLSGYNIAREVAMIAIPKCLNSKYLLYSLISPMFWKYMNNNLRGIAYKGLNINLLKEYIIPIPPINEQQIIVSKIEELMAMIDNYEKTENKLEEIKSNFPEDMKDSLLQDAMQGKLTERLESDSRVDELINKISQESGKSIKIIDIDDDSNFIFPSNWKHVNLVDVTDLYTGNSIPEAEKTLKYMGLKEGYNYIGTKDVEFNHKINYENGVKIPETESNFKYAFPNATLLCIEGGSAGRKIAITSQKICFGNKLCAFNPIVINPKYLYYYLQSPVFLNTFRNNVTGMIGGVSINKIKKITIPLPSIEEQDRIVKKLERLLPLCNELIQ